VEANGDEQLDIKSTGLGDHINTVIQGRVLSQIYSKNVPKNAIQGSRK